MRTELTNEYLLDKFYEYATANGDDCFDFALRDLKAMHVAQKLDLRGRLITCVQFSDLTCLDGILWNDARKIVDKLLVNTKPNNRVAKLLQNDINLKFDKNYIFLESPISEIFMGIKNYKNTIKDYLDNPGKIPVTYHQRKWIEQNIKNKG